MTLTLTKIKRKKSKKYILDRNNIIKNTGVSSKLSFILFSSIFFIFGIIIIYITIIKSTNTFNMVAGIIEGIIFCIIPICIIINSLKQTIMLLSGKYVIISDELMDKYYHQDNRYNSDKQISQDGNYILKIILKLMINASNLIA